MKTGRLLKLSRPGVELHVYLYQEGPAVKAAVYAIGKGVDPVHVVVGTTESSVEADARSWVEAHFPKAAVGKDGPR
jgi:hypothetical protein